MARADHNVHLGTCQSRRWVFAIGWLRVNTIDYSMASNPALPMSTKKCPFCAEEIHCDAIVCKHCRSHLQGEDPGAEASMMEYKTLTFSDTEEGRKGMATEIDKMANEGWRIKSKEVSAQGWAFFDTCCLGCMFLPLALLGKKPNVITIIMERERKKQHEHPLPAGSDTTRIHRVTTQKSKDN